GLGVFVLVVVAAAENAGGQQDAAGDHQDQTGADQDGHGLAAALLAFVFLLGGVGRVEVVLAVAWFAGRSARLLDGPGRFLGGGRRGFFFDLEGAFALGAADGLAGSSGGLHLRAALGTGENLRRHVAFLGGRRTRDKG